MNYDDKFMKDYRERFYKSKSWKILKSWTKRAYPKKCMKCGFRESKKRKGYLVADHIKAWWYYPKLRLDPNNMQLLCNFCNKEKAGKSADYRKKNMSHTFAYIEKHKSSFV